VPVPGGGDVDLRLPGHPPRPRRTGRAAARTGRRCALCWG
jgi:hypothetical protein